MQANKQTDERVAQYLRPNAWLFCPTVFWGRSMSLRFFALSYGVVWRRSVCLRVFALLAGVLAGERVCVYVFLRFLTVWDETLR